MLPHCHVLGRKKRHTHCAVTAAGSKTSVGQMSIPCTRPGGIWEVFGVFVLPQRAAEIPHEECCDTKARLSKGCSGIFGGILLGV